MSRTLNISVEEWCRLCKEGYAPMVRILLSGVSMRPLIRKDRDFVTIAPIDRALKIGDIVLFYRADGKYVVHRVLKLWEDMVQTLGDGCSCPDRPMKQEQVLGLVICVERNGRSYFVNTSLWRCLGRFWMVTLPVRNRLYPILRYVKRKAVNET